MWHPGRVRVVRFLNNNVTPTTWVLIVLSVPIIIVGMVLALNDPNGDTWWGHVMVVPPSVIATFAVLEVAWARTRISNRIYDALRRILIAPTLSGIVLGVTVGLTYLLMGAGRRALEVDPSGYHYWYPAEDGNPWALSLFGGIGIGMFTGFVAFMCIGAPLLAFLHADEFVAANFGFEPGDAAYPTAVSAVRWMSFVLAFIVIAPGAFVLEWPVVGWIAALIGALFLGQVVRLQRRMREMT